MMSTPSATFSVRNARHACMRVVRRGDPARARAMAARAPRRATREMRRRPDRRGRLGRDAYRRDGRSVSGAARGGGAAASTTGSSSRPYRTAEEYAAEGDAFVARHFVNLKNGIEAVPALRDHLGLEFEFVRIQSTMCEAGDMEKVVGELDANFLIAAALGYSCVVYDYGSRDKKRGAPRALWYGLEFVRYALNVEWFGEADRVPVLARENVGHDFSRKLAGFRRSAKKKLRYYRKFLTDDVKARGAVRLVGVYKRTTHDDDDAFYRQLVRETTRPRSAPPGKKKKRTREVKRTKRSDVAIRPRRETAASRVGGRVRARAGGARVRGVLRRGRGRGVGGAGAGRMCRCAGVSRSRLRAFYANARDINIDESRSTPRRFSY